MLALLLARHTIVLLLSLLLVVDCYFSKKINYPTAAAFKASQCCCHQQTAACWMTTLVASTTTKSNMMFFLQLIMADAWCLASWLLGLLHGDDAACFPISTSFPLPVTSSFLAHCNSCPLPSTPPSPSTIAVNCHYLVDCWLLLSCQPSLSHWPSIITIAIPNVCHICHIAIIHHHCHPQPMPYLSLPVDCFIIAFLHFWSLLSVQLFFPSLFIHHHHDLLLLLLLLCCTMPQYDKNYCWAMSMIPSVGAVQWVRVGYCILQKWIWFPSTLLWYSWLCPSTSKWSVSFKFVGSRSYSESPDHHRNPTKVARCSPYHTRGVW